MTGTQMRSKAARAPAIDTKLELIVIPVTGKVLHVDREPADRW
jgi:hypothetical protein